MFFSLNFVILVFRAKFSPSLFLGVALLPVEVKSLEFRS